MAQTSQQTPTFNEQAITVDTINFLQCSICCDKNLALLNPRFDKRSRTTHESYAVLPNCGHAFGYVCLHNWVVSNENPTCPVCRKDVFAGHQRRVLDVFGDSGVAEQHLEIQDIRKSLRDCIQMAEAEEAIQEPAQRSESGVFIFLGSDRNTNRDLNFLERELRHYNQMVDDLTTRRNDLNQQIITLREESSWQVGLSNLP
ncbi:hypothetical protein F4781DRAFT_382902 [Annulohypoxylon bovei var. microspora]|nr:hypothetical protein F4781DRAFT_382902 [Annulohypoxylon bovei var. microspora]